jgi:2-C-methyl-D-erythritol 4-phosphate cytidylyltransferase
MKKIALIVAGGSGSRMKSAELKQFIEVVGKPVLMHTIECFVKWDPEILTFVILPASQHLHWNHLCNLYGFDIPHTLVAGGENRSQSVKNGMKLIPDEGIVFIHDGVRPLVDQDTLTRCYEGAFREGNAIPVVKISESVRKIEATRNFPVDRDSLVIIQTPQTFSIPLIKAAYRQEDAADYTDDATVLEKTGMPINLVEGNKENIKVTWPEDLIFVRAVLELKIVKTGIL